MTLAIILLALWEVTWTGVACWHAARDGHKGWYLFFLIINFLGIPEMIYLSKQKKKLGSSLNR